MRDNVRLGLDSRLNAGGGEFILEVVREIQVNRRFEQHLLRLRRAGTLPNVIAAQCLRGPAFLDHEGQGRILVIDDLFVIEQLEEAIFRYTNRSLTTAEIIAELVKLAKQMRDEANRHEQLGLTEAEAAFYDAISIAEELLRRIDARWPRDRIPGKT